MRSKNVIRQDDRERPILTELIPYEVPLRLSFTQLYLLLKIPQDKWTRWIKQVFSVRPPTDFIPYSYSIRSGEGKERRLGMIHPFLFHDFAEMYEKNSGLIIHLCGKSTWSLRRPVRVAKTYFIKELVQPQTATSAGSLPGQPDKAEEDETDGSESDELGTQAYVSTFFAYEPHNILHRFFESRELLTLERQFSRYRRIDVAKCFSNIYSHSLSWAVKGKSAAKDEKRAKYTFDGQLDRLMQRSNHGETHGILIGSEIARIFAEIILQDVDVRADDGIVHEGLLSERDYAVRRYIDDYFIFYNEDKAADKVQQVLERELAHYKLFINEGKKLECHRPFVTPISNAKAQLRQLLIQELELSAATMLHQGAGDSQPKGRKFASRRVLNQIRLILADRRVGYSEISSYTLKYLHILVRRALPGIRKEDALKLYAAQWIKCVVEIAFFIFGVDLRFRTSVVLSRIVSDLNDACTWLPPDVVGEICDVVIRESIELLRQAAKGGREARLELANFLICLRDVKEYWRIPAALLAAIWLPNGKGTRYLDYFTTVAILYFVADRPEYGEVREAVLKNAIGRISSASSVRANTELLCLTLDLLSCPWLDKPAKDVLAYRLMVESGTPNPNPSDVNGFVNEFSAKTWFFDWRATVSTEIYLRRKELSLSY